MADVRTTPEDLDSFIAKLRDYLSSVEFESWTQQGANDSKWLSLCHDQLNASRSEIERLSVIVEKAKAMAGHTHDWHCASPATCPVMAFEEALGV